MLIDCWYCHTPIDIDESVEGHTEIHKNCLMELVTGGAWDAFVYRAEAQKQRHRTAIAQIDNRLSEQEAAILATA